MPTPVEMPVECSTEGFNLLRCERHGEQLDDHEPRLRKAEAAIGGIRGDIKELREKLGGQIKRVELKVGLWALAGAAIGTMGKAAIELLGKAIAP